MVQKLKAANLKKDNDIEHLQGLLEDERRESNRLNDELERVYGQELRLEKRLTMSIARHKKLRDELEGLRRAQPSSVVDSSDEEPNAPIADHSIQQQKFSSIDTAPLHPNESFTVFP